MEKGTVLCPPLPPLNAAGSELEMAVLTLAVSSPD